MGVVQVAEGSEPGARRGSIRAAVVALRPRQWSKNLLLFAGIVFAAKLGDGGRWLAAIGAFAAYCAASSAAYLVNDVRDRAADRAHPTKRERPIARGEVTPGVAVGLAAALVAGAFVVVGLLGSWAALFLAGFLALQAAYTLGLKHVVLLDVAAIATLFVLRAAAGAEAIDVRISLWLLACTALLALFLALAKRRSELVLVGAQLTPGRRVLEGYSVQLCERLLQGAAIATVLAYTAYTLTSRDSRAMAATIPFVVVGVSRYLHLVHHHDLGEEPENVLLRDRPLIAAIGAWVVVAAVLLATT